MTQKSYKVLLLIETSRAYGRKMAQGIIQYNRIFGNWIIYRKTAGLKEIFDEINIDEVDGVITRDASGINRLVTSGIPTIVCIHTEENGLHLPTIFADTIEISKLAAEHLLDRGFTYFAFCGYEKMDWSKKRAADFTKTLLSAGYKVNIYQQPKSAKGRFWKNERHVLCDWLKSLSKPVGIFACNDDRGQDIINACQLMGIRVPDDVAIIGVDNDEQICELTNPPLSSIALDVEKAGYQAAQLLDKLMNGEKMQEQTINVKPLYVVPRQSTDVMAIKDQELLKAICFIRKAGNRQISVEDVVNAVSLSRRILERRFFKYLNRSILAEIRRVRVEKLCHALVETNLSIKEIARLFGYWDSKNLARFFGKEKGVTPLAYRKMYTFK